MKEGENMNISRRKKTFGAITEIEKQLDVLIDIKNEEDYSRQNIPENLSETERYEKSEEISETISDAVSNIKDELQQITEIL